MQLNRTRNTFRNIAWGSISKIVLIIFPFFVKTVIIRTIGINYLGLNNLFASIIAILNITELGFSEAVVFSLYKPLAEDDTATVCALMSYYRWIYRIIGSIVLAVGIIILPFLPKLIKDDVPNDINIYILYLIFLGNDVLGYFLFAYKSCLISAHQRVDIFSKIRIVVCSLQYIVQIIILMTLKNYYFYIAVQPIVTITINIWNAAEATRLYPQYVCKGKLNKIRRAEIKECVEGLMINKVTFTLKNSADNVFLSAFLGLATVAVYGNYYYILSAVLSIMHIVSDAVKAGVGNSIAVESVERNYQDMRLFMFAYMWLTGIASACLLCLYQPFMELWVGETLTFPFITVVNFVFYFYVLCQRDIENIYCDAAGYWWKIRKKYLIETMLNIVMNFIFIQIWGVNGVIFASAFSTIFISMLMGIPYLHKYYFRGIKATQEYKAHVCYGLVTCMTCIVTYAICSKIAEGLGGLVIKLIACIAIPNLIFNIVYSKNVYYIKMVKIIKSQIIKFFKVKL